MTDSKYLGACDASAAIYFPGTSLFAAASDEGCVLRVYDLDAPGLPVSETDLTRFLEPDDPEETEADIEGAAQVGDRIYWIGSHGRSKKGKERKIRQRVFATRLIRDGAGVRLQPDGKPYKGLLADLISASGLASFDLATAATKKPEEEGGMSIEGLAPTPDGHLLIGFRNPIPGARALIARLRNPAALVDEPNGTADIELAAALDLDGRGIRALEFVPPLSSYLVLAGAFNDDRRFALYLWSGDRADAPRPLHVDISGFNPEEVIVVDSSSSGVSLHLLSDDGTDECKASPPAAQSFRARLVQLTV